MGYYFEWGDYHSVSRIVLSKLDTQAEKYGWLVREEIHDRTVREYLSSNREKIKQWGKENLTGTWTMAYASFEKDRFTVLYFELEEDFVGFKLMWL